MDRQDFLLLYIKEILPEQEHFLYKKAIEKTHNYTVHLSKEEEQAFLGSQTFVNTLNHIRRTDKVYQGLLHGQLLFRPHQAEFDRLAPLIQNEHEHGHPINLTFLRSVDRSRVSLKNAHRALAIINRDLLQRHLNSLVRSCTGKSIPALENYLKTEDLTFLAKKDSESFNIIRDIVKVRFSDGVSDEMIDKSYPSKSLSDALLASLYYKYPELRTCRNVCTSSGEKVLTHVQREVERVKKEICERVRTQFPEKRILHLLSQNDTLIQLQEQISARLDEKWHLQSALLTAIPEHYRDLYPLARKMHRNFILHLGPTNSGKTYEGIQRLHNARRGIYLGPLRLLAAEQFETLNLCEVPCSLITGEERIMVPGSRVQSSTVEMADLKTYYDIAVIDECQMIADRDRGGAWTDAILGLCAEEIHLCASPDSENLLTQIITDCGDSYTIVRHERMTPLVVEKEGFQFPASVRQGDALIVFSKARVHAVAAELKRLGYRVSLIYGALPPDVRRNQAERFMRGENDVVVSTDAIAMGMNLPIERVVFLESEKYDGDITRPLTVSEIKQIAGRAGRYGQYEIGYVNAFGFKGLIAQSLSRPLYPLTEAIMRFPDSLLGIPLPLTQIINQWIVMKDKGCFTKASTSRMATLAAMMENRDTDKHLLYRFLCIPFDETDQDLLSRWRAMYHAECIHEHIDVLSAIPPYLNPDDCTIQMLDDLEAAYRCCDLYYNYTRVFLDHPDAILEEIQSRKSLISQGIIHILSTQKLLQRTCESCKTPLPWNWPHRWCESCFRRHHLHGKQRPGSSGNTPYWDD